MNKWGGPLDKGQWISRMTAVLGTPGSQNPLHAGCLGPRGMATGQTGRPRASSRLLSFHFGQQTKDSGEGSGSWGFWLAFHIRATQTLAKRSAIFRTVSVEVNRGR